MMQKYFNLAFFKDIQETCIFCELFYLTSYYSDI